MGNAALARAVEEGEAERAGDQLPSRTIFVEIKIGDAPDERRFHVVAPQGADA